MDSFFGTKFVLDERLLKKVPAKTHKKRRINKKWLKRYGFKEVPSPYIYFARGGIAIGHPETVEKFKRHLKRVHERRMKCKKEDT